MDLKDPIDKHNAKVLLLCLIIFVVVNSIYILVREFNSFFLLLASVPIIIILAFGLKHHKK